MGKNKIIYFAFLTLYLFSCKKENPVIEMPNISHDFEYTINLEVKEVYAIQSNTLLPISKCAIGLFYKADPKNHNALATMLNVDSMFFKSKKLKHYISTFPSYYSDTTLSPIYPPFSWKIYSGSEIPSLTETITDSVPTFNKYNILVDSISKNGNTFITLGGANSDSLTIDISDGIQTKDWGETISSNTNGVMVANPNWLSLTSSGKITITYFKHYFKTINSKRVSFKTCSVYTKIIKIVP